MPITPVNLESDVERNAKFVERLLKRNPLARANYKSILETPATQESTAGADDSNLASVYETIVLRERPVLFVQDGMFNTKDVTAYGSEAVELVDKLKKASGILTPLLPMIGRIDVKNFPGAEYLGTGWFVAKEIIVTNRHVARLLAERGDKEFVFRRGIADQTLECSFCNAHEYDDANPNAASIYKITRVLYIEPENQPNDIAFIQVERSVSGLNPPYIQISKDDIADDQQVCVIGYPARGPKRDIPDQDLMNSLFKDRYDVKRVAPGLGLGTGKGISEHDCTTLGGNSGSVVLNYKGEAVGLHFAGRYKTANYAIPASTLKDYIDKKIWDSTIKIEGSSSAHSKPSTSEQHGGPSGPSTTTTSLQVNGASQSFTIPLTITISLGGQAINVGVLPSNSTDSTTQSKPDFDPKNIEAAVKSYWKNKPAEVLAARVGYRDDAAGNGFEETPCIAASVKPDSLTQLQSSLPSHYYNIPILYLPADISEQLESMPQLESVDSIAYDDDARTAEKFSFAEVDEEMDVIAHVGPEYSWEVLKEFLSSAKGRMVCAMYEFHAKHIADVLADRLEEGVGIQMVLDNVTFSTLKRTSQNFDRIETFQEWADDYDFKRIVAAEGKAGLISDAYHIKVTVRQDNTFWLSSGNWKPESSQPIITQKQRDNATNKDLPGNREWHVVIKNRRLATFFRNHIRQDFKRSEFLGSGEVPKSKEKLETFVDVPVEESVVLERPAPSSILKPLHFSGQVKVKPLLTPDKEGEVYSEAVLKLIRGAKKSLLFQIPYIGMSPDPTADRGYIDELIAALVEKLLELDDARVLLRSGGSAFSSPVHAAWFFKSKGVNIAKQLKVIEDHHTKGMIVDDRRVLIGSHNWSKPGVTLNRDASLIFDSEDIAGYFRQAFEIDWQRASPLKPKKFVKESTVLEAVGAQPPTGYKRVSLAELMSDD